MRKINIKKYINISLLSLLVGGFMCSCSENDKEEGIPSGNDGDEISLGIAFDGYNDKELRSSGDPDDTAEKKIYSLEVLIFKPDGTRDGYKATKRTIAAQKPGETFQDYNEIEDIKNIPLTAGTRNIYVIANAPDEYFKNVMTLAAFKAEKEKLETQGLYNHPVGTPTEPVDPPIGGIAPSDKKTNLTMYGVLENHTFINTATHHYLGYPGTGKPTGAIAGSVVVGTPGTPFFVERLVARVAIKKIKFDIAAEGLALEGGSTKITEYNPATGKGYTCRLDSVFMVNVKTASHLYKTNTPAVISYNFGHGSVWGHQYLVSHPTGNPTKPNTGSAYVKTLGEEIQATDYDIAGTGVKHAMLWFYTFENNEAAHPTSFVIGARFNFVASDGKTKTVKCYYPVVINNNSVIKRNTQYRLTVTIKGLGTIYDAGGIEELKSVDTDIRSAIEVIEEEGENLFPWTGNVYKTNND